MHAAVARRVGLRSLARARASYTAPARTYATPVAYHQQEVDPQLNGYPQLPNISRQRLPAKGWWDPQTRRNFGDTVRPAPHAHTCTSLLTLDVASSCTRMRSCSQFGVRTSRMSGRIPRLATWPLRRSSLPVSARHATRSHQLGLPSRKITHLRDLSPSSEAWRRTRSASRWLIFTSTRLILLF